MSYKAQLGARFVYPIGYYMYVPDRVLYVCTRSGTELSIPAIFSRLIRILQGWHSVVFVMMDGRLGLRKSEISILVSYQLEY